jgi:tetratricopeptide (TPR) repeat protein/transcriptional regulator with XRE-family HTH domain
MSPNYLLRRARQQRGWSQAVIARHLQTTPQQVSRWERGETHPSPHFCALLCSLFGQNAETLGLLPHDPSTTPETLSPNASVPPSVPDRHAPLPINDATRPRPDTQADSIVGRTHFLASLLSLLEQRTTCTLYGLPGIGKSTLAHMVVTHSAFATHFPAGFLWIGLGPSPQVTSELIRLATLLGVPEHERSQEHSNADWSRLVHQALEKRRMLLVLDDVWNTDDVLPFLVGGPTIAHLVTTRLPHIAFALPSSHPLPVPELSSDESLTLLTTLVPALTTLHDAQLQEVLQTVGGLPLAITLLGRYLRTQSVGGQPRRLKTALSLMIERANRLQLAVSHPPATLSSAQQTQKTWSLAAIIRLSEEQLSPPARSAFHALAILPAKPSCFSEQAALAVCAQGETTLDTLLDAGLLEGVGPGWYTLHQTIADYGRQTLTSTEPWHHLLTYALRFLAEQKKDFPAIAQEYPTLLVALEATTEHKWHQQCFQLIEALEPFWLAQCLWDVTEKYLRTALAAAQGIADASAQILLFSLLAARAIQRTDHQQAEHYLQQGLSIARQNADKQALLSLLNSLGNLASNTGNLELSLASYQECLTLASQLGDILRQAIIHNNLGDIFLIRGRLHDAEKSFRTSLSMMRQVPSAPGTCVVLTNLGECLRAQGLWKQAHNAYQEALTITEEEKLLTHQCMIYPLLGSLAWENGNATEAQTIFANGLAFAQQLEGLHEYKVPLLLGLTLIQLSEGKREAATDSLRQAETLEQTLKDMQVHTALACCQAKVLLAQQRFVEAQHCLLEAYAFLPPWRERDLASIEYALAQVAAAQGNQHDTTYWGNQCLQRFVSMDHVLAPKVRRWLDEILAPSPAQREKLRPNVSQAKTNLCNP